VRPGITGLAQVAGLRGAHTSLRARIEHDLRYIEQWSLLLDLIILVRTGLDCIGLHVPAAADAGAASAAPRQDEHGLVALAETGEALEQRPVEPVRRVLPDVLLVEHEQRRVVVEHRVEQRALVAGERKLDHAPAGVPAALAPS